MYVKKSPRNTKVIGTETGAVPWQILRPPQCDDRKGGTLQQEVAQSSQRRRRASFPVIDATSAAAVVPVDRRRRCSPHISPFPFPPPPYLSSTHHHLSPPLSPIVFSHRWLVVAYFLLRSHRRIVIVDFTCPPISPSSNLIVDCDRKLPPPSTHTALRKGHGRHPSSLLVASRSPVVILPSYPQQSSHHHRCRRHRHHPPMPSPGGTSSHRPCRDA